MYGTPFDPLLEPEEIGGQIPRLLVQINKEELIKSAEGQTGH